MSHSKKKWSDEQKLKVVLDFLSGQCNQAEVARNHQVHPNQVKAWADIFASRAPKVFSNEKTGLQSEQKENPVIDEEIRAHLQD